MSTTLKDIVAEYLTAEGYKTSSPGPGVVAPSTSEVIYVKYPDSTSALIDFHTPYLATVFRASYCTLDIRDPNFFQQLSRAVKHR